MVIYADNEPELATKVEICPQYVDMLETRPRSDDRAIHDYGVILLAKDEKKKPKRQGLGLSLALGSNGTLQSPKEVRVYGYGETGGEGLLHSSGPLKRVTAQLEYQAPTEPGMSGSPVWIPYGGQAMAVGVQ